jgi:NHLM bacteriocin system ABC transporter peptidase/ATP-binding protein
LSEAEQQQQQHVKKPPRRRVKSPTVLQMEAVECGAAALGSVLSYHDLWIPLEELRQECGVSRDGSKASNVLKAARRYGMEAKGYKYKNIERLYDIDFPAILFWNYNHFVVLDGFKGDKVYLNDPAQGPRIASLEELDGSYSGVVLTFKPGEGFEPGGQKPTIIPALRRRLEGSELALLLTILCGLLLVIPGLVIPAFSKVFIDEFLVRNQDWVIQPLLVAMGLTVVVQAVLTWLQEYYLLRLEMKLALSTSSRFFRHILRLPMSYFGQRFAGEIGSRVALNDRVARVLSGQLATTIIDATMTIFYVALMLVYDVFLTVVVVFIAMINVVVVKLAGRARADTSRRLLQDKGKLTGTAMSGLQMIETLKATGSESEFFARWAGYHAKTINTEQSMGLLSQVVSAVPPFVQTASRAAVLLIGGLKVMEGELTVGMLVAYQTLLQSFTRPLTQLVQFGSTIQELHGDMNRLDDVLRYEQDSDYQQGDRRAGLLEDRVKLQGRVELRDIEFGYSPLEAPLISGLNLEIEPGKRVAFVGSSGSGKSTVAKLVTGLHKPWSGQILFDGIPREEIPSELLVGSVAMVDQEPFLFGGSVTENVTMWEPSLSGARVAAACRDAAVHDVIESRDGGYQTWVQDGGGNFSGGQCQRLEIARSLVGDPTILVLDEATSALDPTTEVQVDEAIRRRGCTALIVAHRLSTIRDCDEIVVLDQGKVVQRGTHDEMKDIEGPYRDLISL